MINKLRTIANFYGFSLYAINYDKNEYSYACPDLGRIYLIRHSNKKMLISRFFHELAHLVCTVEGKYINYHLDVGSSKRTYLRAEKYVDKRGRGLMALWYPELVFIPCYGTEEDIQWLRDLWDK